MQHWCVLSNLLGKKNLNVLNTKLPSLDNQTLLRSTRCFASNSRQSPHLSNSAQCKHLAVSPYGSLWRFPPLREFSSSKALFSLEGSNKSKADKQVRRLSLALTIIVGMCMFASYKMETHQDHVIIQPVEEK